MSATMSQAQLSPEMPANRRRFTTSDNKKCNGKPAKDCCNSIYHYMQPKAV